ncbi:MAG: peptidoglycan-binding protein [Pseudomonadota bacterium]
MAKFRTLVGGASAAVLAAFAFAPAAHADFKKGVDAFNANRIDTARDAWARYGAAGDVRSMKILGDLYSLDTLPELEGKPVPRGADGIDKDLAEALAWYTLAAFYEPETKITPEERSAQIIAEERVGNLRETMTEEEVDEAQDRIRYLLASSGSGYHMLILGKLYQRGLGMPKDDKKALLFFRLAADRDIPTASAYADSLAGRIPWKKRAEKEKFEEDYINWQPPLPADYRDETPYLKALKAQEDEAQKRKLREALERTNRIPTQLIQEGLNALGYRAGAEDGKYGPATRAAVRRWEYDRVRKNKKMTAEEKDAAVDGILSPEEKVKLIRAAAAREHPKSQYTLGLLYAEGVGVEADGKKAVKELKDAADHLAIANYALGMIYIRGTTGINPIDPNAAEARYYLGQAYSRGYGPALEPLSQIEFEKNR